MRLRSSSNKENKYHNYMKPKLVTGYDVEVGPPLPQRGKKA